MNDGYRRGSLGVVVSATRDEGTTTLVFDDVNRSGSTWEFQRLFTVTSFTTESFDEVSLSDEELANIGRAIVARLAALAASQQKR